MASVLMLAADSDPMLTFSAPFLGSLSESYISSQSFCVNLRRSGVPMDSANRFLKRTDLGVPK